MNRNFFVEALIGYTTHIKVIQSQFFNKWLPSEENLFFTKGDSNFNHIGRGRTSRNVVHSFAAN